MQAYIEDIYDFGEDAFETGMSPTFLGGVGGIVAGAMVSGLLSSQLSFSSTVGQAVSSGGIFLIGAGLYGYGSSGRIMHPALRSATQVTGIVVGGVGLGRLLATLGAPTLGLGAESEADNGRVVGQDYSGRTLGQAAEDRLDRSNTDYQERWNAAAEGPAQVEEADPAAYTAKKTLALPPSWTSGVSPVANPWEVAEQQGMVAPSSSHGVTQWFGSAEGFTHSSKRTTIGNIFGGEGIGSIIGQ